MHSNRKNFIKIISWIFFLLCLFAAASFTGCDPALFISRRAHLSDLAADMLRPDLSYFPKILLPLFYTIQMSVTGTVIGSALALVVSPLGALSLRFPSWARRMLRLMIQVLRSFPALILALAATFLFGLGTFAGTFAITLYTFAIMTKLTYEDAEHADTAPYEALISMGCARFPAFVHAVLPEILPAFLTNALYLFETNVRHSSILGYVGAGGIGLILNEKISWREFHKVGTILLLLFLTVCVIESANRYFTAVIHSGRMTKLFSTRNVISPKNVPTTDNAPKEHAAQLTQPVFYIDQRILTAADTAAASSTITHQEKRQSFPGQIVLLGFAALFFLCLATQTPPDFSRTSSAALKSMAVGLTHPDWTFFFSTKKDGLGYLLLETICIAIVGTSIGAVLAAPLAFLNTRRFVPAPIAFLFNLLIMAIRSIPFLIYGLIFIRVSGPGAFTGVLTLAVCSIGLLTKRFTECLEAIDPGPYRALLAMGVHPVPAICHSVLPQIAPAFFSAVLYRFDVNIREASVLGLVGAGGIGAPLIFAMNQYDWNKAGAILLGLILLVWAVDMMSSHR